jgi:hypothetical protein
MKNKRRQITVTSKRPAKDLDAVENRLRALHGEARNTRLADLYQLLGQIAQDKVRPATLAYFAQEMADIFKRKDGDALRGLAALVDAPVARPAEEIAYGIEAHLRGWAAEIAQTKGSQRNKLSLPAPKRAAIIESIMQQTQCDRRTAERAIDKTKLRELLGWKAGRPSGS